MNLEEALGAGGLLCGVDSAVLNRRLSGLGLGLELGLEVGLGLMLGLGSPCGTTSQNSDLTLSGILSCAA